MRGVYLDVRHAGKCPRAGLSAAERRRPRAKGANCNCTPLVWVKVAGEWVDHQRLALGWTQGALEPIANAWARRREQHKTGVAPIARRAAVPLLESWGDRWIANIEALSTGPDASYSPNTLDSYRTMWSRHIRPDLGSRPLTAVTPEVLNAWVAKKLAAVDGEKALSKGYVRQMLALLSGMYTDAIDDALVSRNPASVSRHGSKRRRRSPNVLHVPFNKRARISKVLELDHCALLLDSTDGVLQEMVTMVLSTGLRAGEIAGLEWSDVSFPDRRIRVERQHGRNGQRDPKYDQQREVFLWSRLAALLGRRREAEGPVFLDPDTQERFRPQKMTALLNVAWEAVAPRPMGHSWHTLRHTYASLLADAGVADRLIEETLGHKRADVTSRYIHRFDPALARLEGPLEEALGLRLDALGVDLARSAGDRGRGKLRLGAHRDTPLAAAESSRTWSSELPTGSS